MTPEELKERFRKFSIQIIKMVRTMPHDVASMAVAKQIIRSGTSPAANYRAACLAKSNRDFLNKLKMVEEEIDETAHWLSIIMDAEILPKTQVEPIYDESIELRRIVVRSITTMRQSLDSENRPIV